MMREAAMLSGTDPKYMIVARSGEGRWLTAALNPYVILRAAVFTLDEPVAFNF